MEQFNITNEKDRIDKILSLKTNYSRTQITKMLEGGAILVNKKRVKPNYQVKNGDIITVENETFNNLDLTPQNIPLDIVYEDEDILLINKPTGLVVHPGSGNSENTLVNGLLYYTKNLSTLDEFRPGIVHRIDKDTSGLMLVAKNNQTHAILTKYFAKHEIKREYVALLVGVLPNNHIKVDAPIGRDPKNRKMMCVTSKNSKTAITNLEVIKRYQKNTLVKLNLETGRTHQIRVHMKYIGYPVFNDPLYGKEVIKGVGQFLHSKSITFNHPTTNKLMHFETPLPDYFKNYLDTLEEIS